MKVALFVEVVSGSLLISIIILYSIGIVATSFLISSLFHNSGSAVKGALVIWILSIIGKFFFKFFFDSLLK